MRTAPTCSDGKLYFGSDDGHAYCIRSGDGSLVWKCCPSDQQPRVLNSGRLISLWP